MAAEAEARDMKLAAELRDAIASFNTKTAERTKLTAADRKALERITAATAAFQVMTRPDGWADRIAAIAKDVSEYVSLTTGQSRQMVANSFIDTPAIESESVRLHLKRTGDEIVRRLGDYIARRTEEVQNRATEKAAIAEALERARKLPIAGTLIAVHDEIVRRIADSDPESSTLESIGTLLRSAIGHGLSIASGDGCGASPADVVELLIDNARERVSNARVTVQ